MDVTMKFKVEHQITQPELDLAVMETCYEEPIIEETYTTEEVQMRSQAQKQGQNQQGSQPQFQKQQYLGQKNFQGNQNKKSQDMDQVTSLSTTKEITSLTVTSPST